MPNDVETLRRTARAIVKSMSPEVLRAMAVLAADGRLTAVLESALVRFQMTQQTVDYIASFARNEIVSALQTGAAALGKPVPGAEVITVTGVQDVRRTTTRREPARAEKPAAQPA